MNVGYIAGTEMLFPKTKLLFINNQQKPFLSINQSITANCVRTVRIPNCRSLRETIIFKLSHQAPDKYVQIGVKFNYYSILNWRSRSLKEINPLINNVT